MRDELTNNFDDNTLFVTTSLPPITSENFSMASVRLALRFARPSMATFSRPLSTTSRFMASPGSSTPHPNAEDHRKIQKEKPLGPHMTNTNSTEANNMPSAGKKNAPPEFLSDVDPDFAPKDSIHENTERMTGGTQKQASETATDGELKVGEMEGGSFRIEPLRRTGEDANTMRARLVCRLFLWQMVAVQIANCTTDQSRKRGTLESDLLMSTFAETHLDKMSMAQMAQYDLFLDENDWDIYYWATQEPSPTSRETAEGAGAGPEGATPSAQGIDPGKQTGPPELETDEWRQGKARSGEWAQTIGTFKPAYRPVPARWRNSEILALLRKHVISRSAGGIHNEKMDVESTGGGEFNPTFSDIQSNGKILSFASHMLTPFSAGMAFMPQVRNMDS